jgi:uncharacterized protein YcbK (DUF882 family)
MGDLSRKFSRKEFACHCGCGTDNVSPELVAALQELRDRAGRPVMVVSGCRCPEHNREVGGEPQSFHLATEVLEGRAGDVRIPGLGLWRIYELAREIPAFARGGIGVYPENGFVHLDVRGGKARWAKVGGKYVSIEEAGGKK